MNWFKRLFKSRAARAVSKLVLELSIISMDDRVVRPLLLGLYSARDVAVEIGAERETRFLDKLLRYMGSPGRPALRDRLGAHGSEPPPPE